MLAVLVPVLYPYHKTASLPLFVQPEAIVEALLVDLAVLAMVLMAVLWSGSMFFQSSWYTTPAGGIAWRAPLAAALITGFFSGWSLLNVSEGTTTPSGAAQIPYGVLWEFSPRVDVVPEPVPEIVSKRRTSEPAVFKLVRNWARDVRYKNTDSGEIWDPMGVEYVEFSYEGQQFKFEPDKTRGDGYVVFVDADTGYEMREYEIGTVGYVSSSHLAIYALLNVAHFAVWVFCIWLLLSFDFWHAVAIGAAMWLICTLTVLPILAEAATTAVAEQAQKHAR